MLKSFITICFLAGLLLAGCKGQDNRKPPGSEDVFAVRDSIRMELFLRIGRAQQEANRQLEALNNRAYDAAPKTARRLRQKIADIERSREELNLQIQRLQQDSLLDDWSLMKQETEQLIFKAGKTLDISF